MTQKTLETSMTPHVVVQECLGDLLIRPAARPAAQDLEVEGGERPEERGRVTATVGGAEEALTLEQEGETLVLSSRENCRLTCPVGTILTLQAVRGDLRVKGIEGALTAEEINGDANLRGPKQLDIQKVYGDLRVRQIAGEAHVDTIAGDADLRDLGALHIHQVHGDLRARQIDGDVDVRSIASDARVEHVAGEVTIGHLGSDLLAEGLAQGLNVEGVGSDVRLGPPFTPGATYRLNVGSDLLIKLPPDADVRFEFQAGGGVQAHVPNLEMHQENATISGVLGEGAAIVEARVGGRVRLESTEPYDGDVEDFEFGFDAEFDFEDVNFDFLDDLGPMIEGRIAEAMAGLDQAMANLDVRLQEKLQSIDGEKIRAKIERAAERATEHARRTAERAAERARQRAEHAERRWHRASGHRAHATPEHPAPERPTPPEPEPAPQEADQREERLQVLKMLEEGQISPDEAAQLLAALR